MATTLNYVISAKETQTVGVLIVNANFTDDYSTYDMETVADPNDPYSEISPQIFAWLEAHPEFVIDAYVPPSPEEIRQNMPRISRRNLRLGLIDSGISPLEAQSIIDNKPAGNERDRADVIWNESERFSRLDPLVVEITTAYGMTPEQVDTMWNANADGI